MSVQFENTVKFQVRALKILNRLTYFFQMYKMLHFKGKCLI